MHRSFLVAFMLTIGACSPNRDTQVASRETGAAARTRASTRDSITQMIQAYEAATVRKDTATLRRLIDSGYVGLGPGGDTSRQSDAIAELANAPTTDHYDSLVNTRAPQIEIGHDTASVTGQMLVHGVYKGQMFIHRADYQYRVIRRPDGWKLIYSRFTHAK